MLSGEGWELIEIDGERGGIKGKVSNLNQYETVIVF